MENKNKCVMSANNTLHLISDNKNITGDILQNDVPRDITQDE